MKTKKRTAAEVLASTVYSMSMPFVSAFPEDKNEHLSADISGFESVCRQKLMLENSRENKLRRIMKDAADAVSPDPADGLRLDRAHLCRPVAVAAD